MIELKGLMKTMPRTSPFWRGFTVQNLLLGALAVFVLSGAYVNQGTLAAFTASTTNASNAVSTATLDLTATPNGGSAGGTLNVAVTDFIPGDYIDKGVAVVNIGNVPANLTLAITDALPGGSPSNATLKGTDANNSLHATVATCTDATYTTCSSYVSIGGNVNNVAIGNVLATPSSNMAITKSGGATDTLYFKVHLQLPSTADNTVKSTSVGEKKAAFTFTWTLTQSGTGADRTAG
jgi:hypothetical protein